MNNFIVKKIKRDSFSWGVFDKTKKEFAFVFETKEEAENKLEEILNQEDQASEESQEEQ